MTSDLRGAFVGRATVNRGVCKKIPRLCSCTCQSRMPYCQTIRLFHLIAPVQMPNSCLHQRTSRLGRRVPESALYAAHEVVCLSHKLGAITLLSSFYQEYIRVIYLLLLVHLEYHHQHLQLRLRALTLCLIFFSHSHSTLNVILGVTGRFRPGFAQATDHF